MKVLVDSGASVCARGALRSLTLSGSHYASPQVLLKKNP